MRRSTIFLGIVTSIIGACLFQVKYEVMRLESQYKNICHSIRSSEQSISILKAEWAHLTNPQRLQGLTQKHLGIHPLTQKQVVSFRQGGVACLPRGGSDFGMNRRGGIQSASHVTSTPVRPMRETPVPLATPSNPKNSSSKKEVGKINESGDRDTLDSLLTELAQEGSSTSRKGKR